MLDVKHYIHQLLLALQSLKRLGIHHRDIKPNNFLYNPTTRQGIIIDFGLSELSENYHQMF